MATDYDFWHESEEDVSVDAVIAVLKANAARANAVVKALATALPASSTCACLSAARGAIMTAPELVPPATRAKLSVLYGRYLDR